MSGAVVAGLIILGAALVWAGEIDGCNIKGSVSTKGERIYQMPGQKY